MYIATLPRLRKTLATLGILASVLLVAGSTYYVFRPARLPAETLNPASRGSSVMSVYGYPWQPERLDLVAQDASLVVEGVIDEVLPPVWTTSDGAAPGDIRRAFEQASAHIRTPFRLSVDRAFKGSGVPRTLVFSVYGGAVGESIVTTDELERLKRGSKVIMFLKEHPKFPNVSSRFSPNLFFVIDGDVAHGPTRDVPVPDIVRQLQ